MPDRAHATPASPSALPPAARAGRHMLVTDRESCGGPPGVVLSSVLNTALETIRRR